MMRQIWQDELDSHILDCAAELEQSGLDHASAVATAKQQFGEPAVVLQGLQQVHPWLSVYADWIALIVFVGVAPVLYITTLIAATSPVGFYAATFLLWWWPMALLVVAFGLIRWLRYVIPLRDRVIWLITLSISFVFAVIITLVLDINNFETATYNAGLSLILGSIGWITWRRLSRRIKLFSSYAAATLMITSAWREHGYFEAKLMAGCSYLRSGELGAHPLCQQITWFDPRLVLIYIVLIVAVGLVAYYLQKLWRTHTTAWYQKVLTTLAFALLPFAPVFIHDVNSLGAVDIVPWKVEIDQAYVDILGRHPEAKDYDFYASSRSYKHMSKVRQVLYDSAERRIKINLLYENILKRSATADEIDAYANSYMMIDEIRHELKKQAN